uniref:Uncharacterized protein n=1 Tax=Mola mola TaxID=94237 RepID=A0A3Q3XDS7_MOLML
MTKTAAIAAKDFSSMWLPDIRMSKPVEVEKVGADSPLEVIFDMKLCLILLLQAQSMKINPFPLSPTLSSNKVSVMIVCLFIVSEIGIQLFF